MLDTKTDIQPKQRRSRERRAALIAKGAELLGSSELDELSVADITDALGYSTGSFYSYFTDKEAFFVAIQEWVNEELQEPFRIAFDPVAIARLTAPERLAVAVDFALGYFRRRTGVIRSALRYERRIPQAWAPNRARTQAIVEALTKGLDQRQAEHLQTALQLAFGLMVNAVLHDPGPLRLTDADLKDRILTALQPFLET